MSKEEYILEIEDVSYHPESRKFSDLKNASFKIASGEAALFLLDTHGENIPLYGLMEGLLAPNEGIIKFLGKDWQEMDEFEQEQMRGRIGRIYEKEGWVSNLTVKENVSLSQLHHTQRDQQEVEQEAEEIAKSVGLESVSTLRTEYVSRSELKRYQWVRGFLGQPNLILMDQPETGVYEENFQQLLDLVEKTLTMNCAIIWITKSQKVWRESRLKNFNRGMIKNGNIIPATEDE